jgi:hypothetical protein
MCQTWRLSQNAIEPGCQLNRVTNSALLIRRGLFADPFSADDSCGKSLEVGLVELQDAGVLGDDADLVVGEPGRPGRFDLDRDGQVADIRIGEVGKDLLLEPGQVAAVLLGIDARDGEIASLRRRRGLTCDGFDR